MGQRQAARRMAATLRRQSTGWGLCPVCSLRKHAREESLVTVSSSGPYYCPFQRWLPPTQSVLLGVTKRRLDKRKWGEGGQGRPVRL